MAGLMNPIADHCPPFAKFRCWAVAASLAAFHKAAVGILRLGICSGCPEATGEGQQRFGSPSAFE